LSWLEQTPASWGVLALWDATAAAPTLRVVGSYSQALAARLVVGTRYAAEHFPPVARLPASARGGGPDIIKLLPLWSEGRDWGMLALALPAELEPLLIPKGINAGIYLWMTLLANTLDYQAVQVDLAERQGELRTAYDRERALSAAVRELGGSVIPLLPGVLLVPLIGVIDSERARLIGARVLEGVSAERATRVLLDVTGVPLVDTQVAQALLQTARAATLLGAQVSLVGVRPEIAQSIVGLGVELPGVSTYASLASAIQTLRSHRNGARG